jgi:hypothetical protein
VLALVVRFVVLCGETLPEGSAAVKRNAACLLAARLPDSDLEEILDSKDLELQDYAYQCIAYRTDPLSVICRVSD